MAEGYVLERTFSNGLRAAVTAVTYGKGRIVVGAQSNWDIGYDRAY